MNSPYFLGSVPLRSVAIEKDLGVDMTPKLNWQHQINRLCSKASQKLGFLRRNCYFVKGKRRAKTLYIALVRSIFENCSSIWRPTTVTLTKKIEGIQKRALKWILGEESLHYSSNKTYYGKCKEMNILPMAYRFQLTDLILLHKVIHSYIPMELPSYISFFDGASRLRFCHFDRLTLVSAIIPSTTTSQSRTTNVFANSFFYRVHLLWNKLPLEIREITCPKEFKYAAKLHFFWNFVFIRLRLQQWLRIT